MAALWSYLLHKTSDAQKIYYPPIGIVWSTKRRCLFSCALSYFANMFNMWESSNVHGGNKLPTGVHPGSVGTILWSSLTGSSICQLIVCPVLWEYIVVVCGLRNLYGYSLVQIYNHDIPITFPTLKWADHLSHFS